MLTISAMLVARANTALSSPVLSLKAKTSNARGAQLSQGAPLAG
jgi:hypothetical protein